MELDRIDRKIIAALMADATMPLARLADRVGLSNTPCWKRVKRLTERGSSGPAWRLSIPNASGWA